MNSLKVIGVDPGSLSWDFFGLDNNEIILDTSIPSRDLIETPTKAISVIKSVEKIDLMVAPSGFGLPLKRVNDLTEEDIFFTLLKFNKSAQSQLLGLGNVLRMIQKEKIPGVIVPGVKHLPTIPTFRKVNKIDMGTADKLCTAVCGIRDQVDKFEKPPEKTNFIMVEIGYGFTAVLAIENGQIIDGIGGSNIMGFQACGSLDGELAYLIKHIKKQNIYRGGVSFIAGYDGLSLQEIALLSSRDDRTKMALDAYFSSVQKAVFGISSSFSSKNKIREILLAGRGAEINLIQKKMDEHLNQIAPVRIMKSYSHLSKRAAQGAAFIANGLIGGEFKPIIENLKIKEASGSILDNIFIPFDKNSLISDSY